MHVGGRVASLTEHMIFAFLFLMFRFLNSRALSRSSACAIAGFFTQHRLRAHGDSGVGSLRAGTTLEHKNPLLFYEGLPKFRGIEPSDVEPAISLCLDEIKKDFEAQEIALKNPEKVEGEIQYDYESVIERLEKTRFALTHTWGIVGHLMGVKNSDELRQAHDKVQPAVVETYQKLGQSIPVFHALGELRKHSAVWNKLEEAQKRIVESSIREMEESGIGLADTQREEFNKIQLELSDLSTKFSNNVLDSTKV